MEKDCYTANDQIRHLQMQLVESHTNFDETYKKLEAQLIEKCSENSQVLYTYYVVITLKSNEYIVKAN